MFRGKNLLDAFTPPRNFRCELCIATSMSQDTTTLEQIIETLTEKRTSELKTISREVRLALITDNTSSFVEVNKLGGIYPIRIKDKKRLLHAKMALIKFSRNKEVIYRLIVLTGNFTTASLNQQIEMAWTNDYRPNNLENNDLKSAALFLKTLLNKYCIIDKDFGRILDQLLKEVEGLIAPNVPSNFIHSIEESLSNQFLEKIKDCKKSRYKHDFLLFGTPFFQDEIKEDNFVLDTIIESLTKEKVIVWNKTDCHLQTNEQNFIHSLKNACSKNCIDIHGIENTKRLLHSKFIFLAHQKGKELRSGFLYLGSGNLTLNGFIRSQNIECGIIIKDIPPIHKKELMDSFHISEPIEGSEFRNEEFNAKEEVKRDCLNPSVLSARIKNNLLIISFFEEEDFIPLKLFSDNKLLIDLKKYPGKKLEIPTTQDIIINDVLIVEDKLNSRYSILVLDDDGKPLKTTVTHRNFEEALSMLKSFPNISFEDDQDTNGEEFLPSDLEFDLSSATDEERVNHHKNFSLYNLSQLIEHISRENEKITTEQIEDWANTLKFTLVDSLKKEEKVKLASLGIDKISTLKHQGFRPSLALEEQDTYSNAINTIIKDWEASLGTF